MKKQYMEIELTMVILEENDVLRTSPVEEETLPPVQDDNLGEW